MSDTRSAVNSTHPERLRAAHERPRPHRDVNFAGLSLDLIARGRFLLCEERVSQGRKTKVPINHRGGAIDATNPASHLPLDVVAKHLTPGRMLAIPLTGDGLICIDIDRPPEEIPDIIAKAGSYATRSASGNTHIWLYAAIPGDDRRNGPYEIYADKRFIAELGDHLPGTPLTIVKNQAFVDEFYATHIARAHTAPPVSAPSTALGLDDDHIIAKCRASRNSAKFEQLLAGDTAGHGGDDSAADLAFVSLLTFFTRDFDQIIRIVRRSGLWRTKWERRDYQQRTYEKALGRSAFYTPRPANSPEIRMSASNGQVAGSVMEATLPSDPCTDVRDELAQLRAIVAQQSRQLEERDRQVTALQDRTERAEARLAETGLLQSATMAMLRSRQHRPTEKIVGLVALFDAYAARKRGATDEERWSDAPLARFADAGGCSTDTVARNLDAIATNGSGIETRTINRRDPVTGAIRKHRQIRLSDVSGDEPISNLPARIIQLSEAEPSRKRDGSWGGKRTSCPDCGPGVGAVVTTTTSCAGCGQILNRETTIQPPASDADEAPMPQLALSKNRGSHVPPMPQLAGSDIDERRKRARQDLAHRSDGAALKRKANVAYRSGPVESSWLRDAPDVIDAEPIAASIAAYLPGLDPPPPDRWAEHDASGTRR